MVDDSRQRESDRTTNPQAAESTGRPVPSRSLDRRRFVLGTGAAALAGLAGCIGDDDDDADAADDADDPADTDDDEPDDGTDEPTDDPIEFGDTLETAPGTAPDYAKWFAAEDESMVMRVDYVGVEEIPGYDLLGDGEGDPDQDFEEDMQDSFPVVESIAEAYPTFAAFGPPFIFAFMAFGYPIIEDVGFVDEDETEEPFFEIGSLMIVDDALVAEGTAHEDRLLARDDVEELDTVGEYTIYGVMPDMDFGFGDEDEDDDEDEFDEDEAAPFAVGNDELVFPFGDDEETVGGPEEEETNEADLATLRGALESASAGPNIPHDGFAWLSERVGDGALVLGGYGELGEEDEPVDEPVDDDEEDLDEIYDIEGERFEQLEEMFEEDADALLFSTERSDTGRVTRSGITVHDADQLPAAGELAELLAEGAERLNVETSDTGIVVEAFWE